MPSPGTSPGRTFPLTPSGAWAGSGRGSPSTGRPTPWSPPAKAARWLRLLLDRPFAASREAADAIFAMAQLARVSGDRVRDLDEPLRIEVLARLEALGASDEIMRPVREFHELEAAQTGQALGDALPTGLRLLAKEL